MNHLETVLASQIYLLYEFDKKQEWLKYFKLTVCLIDLMFPRNMTAIWFNKQTNLTNLA